MALFELVALSFLGTLEPSPADHVVRGMTISCQTWGIEWASPELDRELAELRALGINWIAIHPYARIRGDGTVTFRPGNPDQPPPWLAHPIARAHAHGLKILIKPHLAYWGSPFSWRGDIDFPDPARRARFFASYTEWIVDIARLTRNADAFVVGTELDRLVAHRHPWKRVVERVRRVSPALLTYAANWDSYQNVSFWDTLDAIGVQGYFPLSILPQPSTQALRQGWQQALVPLRALSQKTGKPVVFTELGYNRSLEAARQPWASAQTSGPYRAQAEALQSRAMAVALQTLATHASWLRGAFLWKWFVGEAPHENFMVDTPHMRAVLRSEWTQRPSDRWTPQRSRRGQ